MKQLSLILLISSIFFVACGEPEDDNMIEQFTLPGKWFFQSISGSGVIFGLPQSDKDDEPTGYIEFFEDGTGKSDFSTKLLNQLIATDQSIQWRWLDETTLDIGEEDGVHQSWVLINANNNAIEASWDISLAGNTATLVAELRR